MTVTDAMAEQAEYAELLRALLFQLKVRNAEETWAFKDVFNSHRGLLTLNEKLMQQTVDQDKDIIILRHKLSEGLSQGETSEALRSMQDELQRLQVQVSDRYRSSADAASEQLRLMKEAQLLQDQLRRSEGSLAKLQKEHGESMARCSGLEDSQTLLEAALAAQRAESESLRSLLGGREAEAATLREQARKEREELVTRLLQDKGSMLEEMNKMNEENTALRTERGSLINKILQAQSPSQSLRKSVGADHECFKPGEIPAWLLQQEEGREKMPAGRDSVPSPGVASGSGGTSGASRSGGSWGAARASAAASVPSRCFQAMDAHSSGINDVVFERAGSLLATAGDDSYVKVWDPGSGRQRAVIKGAAHKGATAIIAVDIYGDLVCGGGSDGSCTVWNVKTLREKARLTGHLQKVSSVSFCCSGHRIITGSQDCSIKVWDLHQGYWNAVPISIRATSKCNTLDVSQTWKDSTGINAVIASGHMDGAVRLWDMRSGTRAHCLQDLHTDQVTSVKFAPGRGNLLLTNSKDNTLKLIDARTYQAVACMRHANFRTATNFSRACISPSAQYAAAASSDGNVYIWDLARSSSSPGVTADGGGASSTAGGEEASGVVAILGRHGAAAVACDWRLTAPNMLASCDARGGVRVWG